MKNIDIIKGIKSIIKDDYYWLLLRNFKFSSHGDTILIRVIHVYEKDIKAIFKKAKKILPKGKHLLIEANTLETSLEWGYGKGLGTPDTSLIA